MSYCNDTALVACVMTTGMFVIEMVALTYQQQKLNSSLREQVGPENYRSSKG